MAQMLEHSSLRTHPRKASIVWAALLGLLLPMFMAQPARATHETIAVDGNLADLIAAIGRNTGASNGGFAINDGVQGEIYTSICRYVNGYDVRNYYFFLDFKDAAGHTPSNVRLYGGWDVYGIIGDVDGDGNPTTFNGSGPGAGCALQENAGIGPLESYTVEFDTNCDGFVDMRISVKDNKVQQILPTVVDLTGRAAFAVVNGFLEMRVDNFQNLVPAGTDLCNVRVRMTANAELDALGEDRSSAFDLLIAPSVAVTKLPATRTVCPGEIVEWTIDAVNDGLCHLDTVLATDVLSAGLTFVSSTPTRARGDAQRSEWDFTNLAPGQHQPITIRAQVAATCTSPLQNQITIEGTHIPPAPCNLPPQGTVANATATLTCSPCVVCSITLTPGPTVCTGTPVSLCAPTGNFTYLWTLPNGTTQTSRCITIPSATTANSGGYRLALTVPGGPTDTCSTKLTVTAATCAITGPDSLCTGRPLTLCGPAGFSTYRWTRPDGTTVTTSDQCITFGTPLTGIYSLVATDASGCSTAPCTKAFKTTKPPACAIAGPTTACPGVPVQFCGPVGNFTYLWTLPNGATRTTQCITVDPLAGRYRLVVTDVATGCTNECFTDLTVLTRPVCSVTGPDSLCPDIPAEFCGPTGNFSYSWILPDGSTRVGRCITVAIPIGGLYKLVVTDLTTGCKSDTCSKELKVRKRPACAIAGPETACVGQAVQLCGPVGNFTYTWTRPNGTTVTTRCLNIAAATLADGGVYRLVVRDGVTGCLSDPCTLTLVVRPKPDCTITTTPPGGGPVCLGSTVEMCGPTGTFTYRWTLPNGSTVTTRCVRIESVQAANAGVYRLVVTDPATGCESDPCTFTLVIGTPPVCSITLTPPSTNPACIGSTFEMCGPTGNFTYLWTLPNGTTVTTRCVRIESVQTANAGLYRLVVTDAATGCASAPCTLTLGIGPPLACSVTQTPPGPVVPGTRVELCGPVGNLGYRWTLPNGSIVTTRCVVIPSAGPADAGKYVLTVTDLTTGCVGGGPGTPCNITLEVLPGCDLRLVKTATPEIVTPQPVPGCDELGRPTSLTFQYTGLNCSATHHTQDPGKVVCTDFGTLPSSARIKITDSSTEGSGHVLFDGTVAAGALFEAKASTGGLSTYSTNSWAYIYSGSTLVEKVQFHTSCSQPLLIGDQYGTLLLVGFNGATGGTQVTYTYVVTNGATPVVDATITDDKLGVIAADFDLAANQSRTFTKIASVGTTTTNVATVRGRLGSPTGLVCEASDDATVTSQTCACVLNYPDNSNPPRSQVIFNESEVLRFFDPGPLDCGSGQASIKLWYNDEHALTLGVRRVVVKTSSGTTTTDFPITPTPGSPTCVDNPLIGTTASGGDLSGNDVAAGGGRPLWPALFITDLTENGETSRAGDWQQGGVGIAPHRVCGTWKGAVRTVDKTRTPEVVTVTPDADPAKNDWNLGGGDTPSVGFGALTNQGYGAEVVWFVDRLNLIPGHAYRLYFMVHDGDQNKSGGDVGHGCTTIRIPGTDPCPSRPACDITGPSQIIPGDVATLCGPTGSGLSYLWSTGSTASCIQVTSAATYTLRVTDQATGCSRTCSHTVSVTPSESCLDGKPRSLVFEYTGQGCSAGNNPQSGKATCTEQGALGTAPVQIVYTGSSPELFTVSPSGETVVPGTRVTISATGRDRFLADSKFEIRRGGVALQTLGVHTSCSQQLIVGDQFGSLLLREFHTTLITSVTLAGAPVDVHLGSEAEVMYQQVVDPGTTSLSYHTAPALPSDLTSPEGEGVKVATTAGFTGGLEVTLAYDPAAFNVPETALKLMRYDGTGWTEITSAVDLTSHTISGTTSSLSMFAIAAPQSMLAADDPPARVDFGIHRCFPNPTTGATTISYALPRSGTVRLTIHDVQGRQVAGVVDGLVTAGEHTAVWNGRGTDGRRLPTGIYMIRLESVDGLRTGKLVLVK